MGSKEKDQLINHLDTFQKTWDAYDAETKKKHLEAFVTTRGIEHLTSFRFELLPDILQLMLTMTSMDNKLLEELAIKEGYLDVTSRMYIQRNIVIVAIAGSINRGSTATETSAYRRTGTTRWSKDED